MDPRVDREAGRPGPSLLDQINKRTTLNLLIQGCATHAFAAHHLVSDEIRAIDPELVELYDQAAALASASHWYWESRIVFGSPTQFWKRIDTPGHPFRDHRLLARYGYDLAEAHRQYATEQAHVKGVSYNPVSRQVRGNCLVLRLCWKERKHRDRLAELAKRATAMAWGIDPSRIDAELTWDPDPSFGILRRPKTFRGRIFKLLANGWGGVAQSGSGIRVVAKADDFLMLCHELTKATAELVCLHGLNALDPETYATVMEFADRVDYEWWELQAGPELWRRLLAAMPQDSSPAKVLMHVALLDPLALDVLMHNVLENRGLARRTLESQMSDRT